MAVDAVLTVGGNAEVPAGQGLMATHVQADHQNAYQQFCAIHYQQILIGGWGRKSDRSVSRSAGYPILPTLHGSCAADGGMGT